MAKSKAKAKSKSKPNLKSKPKSKPKAKAKAKAKAGKVTAKAKPKAKAVKAKPMNAKAKAKSTPAKTPAKSPAKSLAKAPVTRAGNLSAKFSPLDDRLVVEEVEAATRTPGGLYIPDTVEVSDRPQQGKVLAVGRGQRGKKGRIRPLDVSLGDTVLFEKFMGTPIKIDGRDCVLIRESQLLGVVRE